MQLKQIYTVEYSVVQHAYHIETLDRALQNNLSAVDKNLNNGYLIIGLFNNWEAAARFVDYHRARQLTHSPAQID